MWAPSMCPGGAPASGANPLGRLGSDFGGAVDPAGSYDFACRVTREVRRWRLLGVVEIRQSSATGPPPDPDGEVYAAHAPRLLALAAALAGPSAADDVMAEAVVRAMSSPAWARVKDHGAYLSRAVVNEARSAHRRDLRRELRERRVAGPDVADASPDPVPELLAALTGLTMKQRAAVFLTYWEDMAPATVAIHLGTSEGSVRKHLARARAHLRKELR